MRRLAWSEGYHGEHEYEMELREDRLVGKLAFDEQGRVRLGLSNRALRISPRRELQANFPAAAARRREPR